MNARTATTRRAAIRVALAAAVLVALPAACGSVKAAGNFAPRHANTLTVATGEIPLEGLWEGTPSHPTGGFEFELAKELARQFGLAHVKVVVVPFGDIVAGHLGGADLALSDITATPARGAHLDFSEPYLSATAAVLVRAGQSVPDLETAQGLTWAVGRSSTLRGFLEDTIQPTTHTLLSSSLHDTTSAVLSKRVDAGLLDLPVASATAHGSNGALAVAGQFDFHDDTSAALPSGSANLDAVGSAIRSLQADGTIGDLAHRWLGLSLNGTSADQVPLIRTNG